MPSPERIPEVDVQTTLDPSIRGNSGDGFRASADDQIRDNDSRPGWVSKRHVEKDILANINLISALRIERHFFEEPVCLSVAGT